MKITFNAKQKQWITRLTAALVVPELSMKLAYGLAAIFRAPDWWFYDLNEKFDLSTVFFIGIMQQVMVGLVWITATIIFRLRGALVMIPLYVFLPTYLMDISWDEPIMLAITLNAALVYLVIYTGRWRWFKFGG